MVKYNSVDAAALIISLVVVCPALALSVGHQNANLVPQTSGCSAQQLLTPSALRMKDRLALDGASAAKIDNTPASSGDVYAQKSIIGSVLPSAIYGPVTAAGFSYSDLDSATIIVPDDANAINISARSCYVRDDNPLSSQTINGVTQTVGAGVCDWGMVIANVTNATVWGKAHYLSDTSNNSSPPNGTTGRGLIADEEDFQANAVDSDGNPSTRAAGAHLLFGGRYLYATGYTVGSRGSRNMDEAFTVADGTMKPGGFASIVGIDGSPSGTAAIGSQVRRIDWYDGMQRQSWKEAVQIDGGYLATPTIAGKPFRSGGGLAALGGDSTTSQHFISLTTIQQPSSCGASPRATGTDHGGTFTFGTGIVKSCKILYGRPYPTNAYATLTPTSYLGSTTFYISSQDRSGFVLTMSASSPQASFDYSVNGN